MCWFRRGVQADIFVFRRTVNLCNTTDGIDRLLFDLPDNIWD